MLDVAIHPPDVRTTYLDALNRCFPGWGGPRQYAWAFERALSAPPADLMVIREDGVLLAGSAVSYRRVALPNGRQATVGIMTGSWTLPEARGRGCFTRVIEESVRLTASHGGAALIAFVTEDNASYRRLRDAGAGLFPTRYFFPRDDAPAPPAAPIAVQACDAVDELLALREEALETSLRVVYGPTEWRGQLLQRDGDTRLLRVGDLGFAVTEHKGNAERIQALLLRPRAPVDDALAAVAADVRARGHRFATFTMDPAVAAGCERLGLRAAPGFLTALVADPAALRAATGASGEGPELTSAALADPGSPFYLGQPAFQSGDRM